MNVDFFGLFDFEAGDSDTYQYSATEFNQIIKAITSDGVVKDHLDEMAVSLDGLNVTVGTGAAFIQGRLAGITSAKALTVSSTGSAHKDRVILKLDVENRVITVEVKQGTSTPPALTQTALVYEISLAQVSVPATGVETSLTDERIYFYNPTKVMDKMNAITGGTEYVYAVYA